MVYRRGLRQEKKLIRRKYLEYLQQFDKPPYKFMNKNNLFYDLDYRDMRALMKTRRYIAKHHLV
jgi:hypothetical protein